MVFFSFSDREMPFTGKEKVFKNIEFWIVSSHTVKIWDYLNENWLS